MYKNIYYSNLLIFLFFTTISFYSIIQRIEATSYENKSSNIITLISLVRGKDRWIDTQTDWMVKQFDLIQGYEFASTWLLDYDALTDESIISVVKTPDPNLEVGLFLEIPKQLALDLNLPYDQASLPHKPHNTFISGYSLRQRQQIIDHLVTTFETEFGYSPQSAGAWFIDSWSLNYLAEEYGIDSILLVAEQYGTDHHTIRGHTWQEPFYPSQNHALIPGYEANQLNSVVVQWAVREPLRGYGFYREFSNFSVQANDYVQQGLEVDYFENLLNTYLIDRNQKLNQLTLGIEVGQEGAEYFQDFNQLLSVVSEYDQVSTLTLQNFADVFRDTYTHNPQLRFSQWHDPDGNSWAGWITASDYRVGLVADETGIFVRDLRTYIGEQDDSWMYADRRHDLFRQVEAIIDQVGLNNDWYLTTNSEVIPPEVEQSDSQLKLIFGDKYLEFDPKKIVMNFNPTNPPSDRINLTQEDDWFVVGLLTLETSEVANHWIWYSIILTLVLFVLAYLNRAALHWLIAILIAVSTVALLNQEVWLLSPVNDLGWIYLSKSNFSLFMDKLLAYLLVPGIYVGISLLIYKVAIHKIKRLWGGWLFQVLFAFGTSLGWAFPLYRQLPLQSGLVTGIKSNLTNFSLWFEMFNLERLTYAFSAGQMHIGLAQQLLDRGGLFVLLPIILFMFFNWGILLVGWIYHLHQRIKFKQWLRLGLLLIAPILVATSTSLVDIRGLTLFDLTFTLICLSGLVLWLAQLNKSKPRLFLAVIILLVLLVWVPIQDLVIRNKQLQFRLTTDWSDRQKTHEFLSKQEIVTDIYLMQINQAESVLSIPKGVQDYMFVEPMEIRQKKQILMENSHSFVLGQLNN